MEVVIRDVVGDSSIFNLVRLGFIGAGHSTTEGDRRKLHSAISMPSSIPASVSISNESK